MQDKESSPTPLMTVAEVARRLSVSMRTVRTLIALGHIPVICVSRNRICIDAKDVESYIVSRKQIRISQREE